VNGFRIAEAAALRYLHRIDIAHEVTDRGIGSRELLSVPLTAVPPSDR
jgi:hypothetical protein